MQEYNERIARRMRTNVDRMIFNVPQPDMMPMDDRAGVLMYGGKRERLHPLPGTTQQSGSPSTLGVQSDYMVPDKLEDAFYNDFDRYHPNQLVGGKHSGTYQFFNGLKNGLGQAAKVALPIAAKVGTDAALAAMMAAGRPKKTTKKERGGMSAKEAFGHVARGVGQVGRAVGRAAAPVARELVREVAPHARELFRDVVVPEGKRIATRYLKDKLAQASASASQGGVLTPHRPNEYRGRGRGRGRPQPMMEMEEDGGARNQYHDVMDIKLNKPRKLTLKELHNYIRDHPDELGIVKGFDKKKRQTSVYSQLVGTIFKHWKDTKGWTRVTQAAAYIKDRHLYKKGASLDSMIADAMEP